MAALEAAIQSPSEKIFFATADAVALGGRVKPGHGEM